MAGRPGGTTPPLTYSLWMASATHDHNFLNMSHPSLPPSWAWTQDLCFCDRLQHAKLFSIHFSRFQWTDIAARESKAESDRQALSAIYRPCPPPSFAFFALPQLLHTFPQQPHLPSLTQALVKLPRRLLLCFLIFERWCISRITASLRNVISFLSKLSSSKAIFSKRWFF